jgi:hypothetical protein
MYNNKSTQDPDPLGMDQESLYVLDNRHRHDPRASLLRPTGPKEAKEATRKQTDRTFKDAIERNEDLLTPDTAEKILETYHSDVRNEESKLPKMLLNMWLEELRDER